MISRLVRLVLLIALVPACRRPPAAQGQARQVAALADPSGMTMWTLFTGIDGAHDLRFVEARTGAEAQLHVITDSVTVDGFDRPLGLRHTAGRLHLQRAGEPAWELRRQGEALRLGDARGIPMARVSREGADAVVYDAGGRPLGRARVAGGRMLLLDREGAVAGYLTGVDDVERGALVGLATALPLGERIALLSVPGWP